MENFFCKRNAMRCSFVIALVLMSFQGWSQTVTLKATNAPISKMFAAIKKQTGYTFFYDADLLGKAKKVTIDVTDFPLKNALDLLFENQPITYSIAGKIISLSGKPARANLENDPNVPPGLTFSGEVRGTVRSGHNQPLDGASIVVQRTRAGVIANSKGEFSLKNIQPNDILQVSMIGYSAAQVPVNAQAHLPIIFLKSADSQLDEVIYTAYSKTSQRYATGNITKITSEVIEKQPVMNPLMALQGRVPGLVVTPTRSFASSPIKMEIRGLNSMNPLVPSDPLYVIDGVALTVAQLSTSLDGRVSNGLAQNTNFFSVTGGQSPLFGINPMDIESIEVLKDADATAVYGPRGSNGVILITTKKGKPGATRFDFNIDPPFFSFGKATRYVKMLNREQYLEMRREALKNDGIPISFVSAPDLTRWDTSRYTNWQKATNGGTAKTLNVSIGVSGGSDLSSFRINANYVRMTNTTNISGATQRATLGTNISNTSRNQKFSLSHSINFAYSYVDVVAPFFGAALAPNAPGVFDKNGNPNWAEWNADGLLDIYPFSAHLGPANPMATTQLTSALNLKFRPFRGFTLSAVLGYNFAYNSNNAFTSLAMTNPYWTNRQGVARFSTTQNAGWTINPQITYNVRVGRGELQLLMVGTEQYTATNTAQQDGMGYVSDALLKSLSGANTIFAANKMARSKVAGLVGGITYNYDGRYIINLNGTRQGSSKFGPDNKYGNFGSAGVAWIASKEPWLKKILPSAFNFLKFRGSYGLTGSDGVDDYQYLPLWKISTATRFGYDGQQTLLPSVRANQKYKWETNAKLEASMDIGLFENRLSMNLVYYRNRVSDQLTRAPAPGYLNTEAITGLVTNVPMVLENSGWEGLVNVKLLSNEKFNVSANFNISKNKNILVAFPGIEKTPYANRYTIGSSLNTVYLLHYTGIDPMSGIPTFEDYDKNGNIDGGFGDIPNNPLLNDRLIVYDLQPKFAGGFGLDGNYKRLSASVFFSYKKQIGKNIYGYLQSQSPAGSFNSNKPEEIFNKSWRKPGDIARYPKFTSSSPPEAVYVDYSDMIYSDASFIRLTNLSIAYVLPEAWSKKVFMKNLTVNLNAQNVLIITKFKGGDPETGMNYGAPPKLFTVRIAYTF